MSAASHLGDLIAVVADADAEHAIRHLLRRPQALRIREIAFTVDRFVKRDPGCYRESHEHLRSFIHQFDYALVLFDRHGSGGESRTRIRLEKEVEQKLSRNGWADRSAAIVLDPELEVWVWSDSPEVDRILGWAGRDPELRSWVRTKGLWRKNAAKPDDPKKAMLDALRAVGTRRSSAVFGQLAAQIGVGRCTDAAFTKLKNVLQQWFPQP